MKDLGVHNVCGDHYHFYLDYESSHIGIVRCMFDCYDLMSQRVILDFDQNVKVSIFTGRCECPREVGLFVKVTVKGEGGMGYECVWQYLYMGAFRHIYEDSRYRDLNNTCLRIWKDTYNFNLNVKRVES